MIKRFVDSRQFRRLQYIKQLGATDYAGWPQTSYSRFDHSLGVSRLARKMASHLKRTQPELSITDRDVNCVEIAGLCHDLGHGPWSHLWDGLFMPSVLKGSRWSHEEGSEMMFDAIIEEERIPLPKEDQQFIKALISGDPSRTPREKGFFFDIVANRRNGFDVDKYDYIRRDNHLIGSHTTSLSLLSLIESSRVIDSQICYNADIASYIYNLAISRFRLHKEVYNNVISKAVNYMIIDGLSKADRVMNIAQRVFNAEEYLTLTDDIMPQIEATTDPRLSESRAILRRIHDKNQHYECILNEVVDLGQWKIFAKYVTGQRILEASRRLAPADSRELEFLKGSDVIVDFSLVHHGMKEDNPMKFVAFYSAENNNVWLKLDQTHYSSSPLPSNFAEVLLSVYSKSRAASKLLEAGCHDVLQNIEANIATANV
ncbi:Deoxynucleoside triphosphate triphosphohydrolase SAMHD1 [Psilocybe cubensis]|uniref:HD/PDEase domain-containing protein n=2 Tax=Psilocybe cubensis TaxID=181762 RepID=A0A8H8CJS4_PSICU|nr:Deoxynucleoside triphosphate triphosphohydrolase SAMHD1 [Psilocybe cubensis]KAH9476787.1 Deoxynucleoside triphosphate triphosphohydrolase SAMHD1 [Psilocybe cubensis]